MMEYSFTIYVDRPLNDSESKALYDDERFLDVAIGESGDQQRGFVSFTVNANSVTSALAKSLESLELFGLTPTNLEDEDTVTASQIAERTGRTRQSIQMLISGKRGPGGFPHPWNDDPALYSWSEVARWFRNELHEPIQPYNADSDVIAATAHMLRANALVHLNKLAPVMTAMGYSALAAA